MTKDEYSNYLRSEHWISFSRAIRQVRKVCERCKFPYELNVHHVSYQRLWHERLSDVELLCKSCHARSHFIDSLDQLPDFVFEVDRNSTAKRLDRQVDEAKQKNIERTDELRRLRELENE